MWLLEEYARYDLNGDGVAELLKIHRVGSRILDVEEIDEQPGVVFCPFPMPGRIVGQSLADKVMDIQLTRSMLFRQGFDNLHQSNAPRWTVSESSVGDSTYDDLLAAPIAGGVIRHVGNQPPIPVKLPDISASAFQMMEVLAGERESRTGITRLNQGLDADALNKMLCIETPVPMATGDYKRLADVDDGDWLIGSDGEPVRVLKAHKIHNPERAYRIRFSSGEEIDAGGEHLWTVQTDNDKRYQKFQTVDTDRLFEMMQGKGHIYIPRVQRPQTGFERELPLDPYMLGTWLGDGHSYAPRVTTMEAETVGYMREWADEHGGLTVESHQNAGAATTYYIKGLYPVLRGMNALKYTGWKQNPNVIGKHIPEEYFHASYRQRLELLRGLMDTDGCHHSNALCVFVQNNGRLLDDVVRLIESLGGWPSVRPASAAGASQVTFSIFDCPFKIERKAKNWTAPEANSTTQVVKSIDRIDIKPMRCLTVQAEDGLFCVGKRFTVTHNTATGTAMMQAAGQLMEDYMARNLAEAFARLLLKKYRLMRAFGRPMSVFVDGNVIETDPRQWPEDMHVRVRVGLGTGKKDQRLAFRQMLLQITQGVESSDISLFTPENIYNQIVGVIEDSGLGNPSQYITRPDDPRLQQQNDKPDPATLKAQADAMIEAQKIEVDAKKIQGEQMLKARQMEIDAQMKQQALEVDLQAKRERAALDAELQRQKADFEAGLALRTQAFEEQMAERRFQFDQEMATKRADQQAQADLPKKRPGGDLDK